jgi:hypothetical protein
MTTEDIADKKTRIVGFEPAGAFPITAEFP